MKNLAGKYAIVTGAGKGIGAAIVKRFLEEEVAGVAIFEWDLALAEKTAELSASWEKLFQYRDDVMKALEIARANKMIGKSLDAKVTVYTTDEEAYATLTAFADKLAEVYITSQATVVKGEAPEGAYVSESGVLAVVVEPADGCKCGRCWSYSTEGVTDEEGGFLCERCRKLLM